MARSFFSRMAFVVPAFGETTHIVSMAVAYYQSWLRPGVFGFILSFDNFLGAVLMMETLGKTAHIVRVFLVLRFIDFGRVRNCTTRQAMLCSPLPFAAHSIARSSMAPN
jgi:hypothetical protein